MKFVFLFHSKALALVRHRRCRRRRGSSRRRRRRPSSPVVRSLMCVDCTRFGFLVYPRRGTDEVVDTGWAVGRLFWRPYDAGSKRRGDAFFPAHAPVMRLSALHCSALLSALLCMRACFGCFSLNIRLFSLTRRYLSFSFVHLSLSLFSSFHAPYALFSPNLVSLSLCLDGSISISSIRLSLARSLHHLCLPSRMGLLMVVGVADGVEPALERRS